ncbi:MAG: LysR family transcriptional regulator [Verrucomicrobiaceae bacterium]
MDINFRQLDYFLKVASLLNISEAARQLNMTQPALSRQIKALEDDLGWTLFERGNRSITLTRAGRTVQKEGLQIQRAAKLGVQRMRSQIDGAEMRIGFAPSLASGLIEVAMSCFAERFPRVRVSWFDCSTHEMAVKLANGELDLIIEVATDDPAIRWEPLRKKDVRIAISTKHPFAKKRFIKPADLDGQRLLLLSRHDYPGYWKNVTGYFRTNQVNAKIAGEFDGISSLRLGIEAGLGMAFVAEGANIGPSIKILPLKPAPNPVCVSLGYSSKRSLEEWERAFLDALRP